MKVQVNCVSTLLIHAGLSWLYHHYESYSFILSQFRGCPNTSLVLFWLLKELGWVAACILFPFYEMDKTFLILFHHSLLYFIISAFHWAAA
jgi:hypothetical protein